MPTVNDASRERLLMGARSYAAADRTDPFAYRRAVAHIDCGVASIIRGETSKEWNVAGGATAHYNADRYVEEREVIGFGGRKITAQVVCYRNMVRP